MVRHESAVALGSVGGEEATKFLREYVQRPVNHDEVGPSLSCLSPILPSQDESVVIESCKVALDAINFWSDMTTIEEQPTEGSAITA